MRRLVSEERELVIFEDAIEGLVVLDSIDKDDLEDDQFYGEFAIAAMCGDQYYLLGQYETFKEVHDDMERYLNSDPDKDFYFSSSWEDIAEYKEDTENG